jgi:arylsulfatase/uncharacterized sulfatase
MVTMPTTRDWSALTDMQRRYEARRMEVYAGMAQAMDHHVGRLVAHLRETGQLDNTVFVFLSDNGAESSDPADSWISRAWVERHYRTDIDSMGAPGAYAVIGPSWASAAASPLSSYKFYAGEGGIRVPLIIAGVPGAAAGSIHHGFAHVTDIVPTLLALSGLSAEAPAKAPDGQMALAPAGLSLLPVITGRTYRARAPDAVVGHELSGGAALFRGDLKLVRNLPPMSDARWRLYDIVRDPGETRDLSDSRADDYRQMQVLYAEWEQAHGVLPMPSDYNYARQVMRNSIMNVYLPKYGPWVAAAVLSLLVGWVGWRRTRRARHRPAAR